MHSVKKKITEPGVGEKDLYSKVQQIEFQNEILKI